MDSDQIRMYLTHAFDGVELSHYFVETVDARTAQTKGEK